MKYLQVFWRHTPRSLDVLKSVEHIRFGIDGEDVITTDEGAVSITAMAREFQDFWAENVVDVDPYSAVDVVLRQGPQSQVPSLLRQLISLVSKEDEGAANSLLEDFEDKLRAAG